MKVPTLLAERGIQTGSTGPDAGAESFGAQTAVSVAGLSRAIGSLEEPVKQQAAIQERRKLIDESDWVSTSISQERKHLLEWMNDPKNNTREDFAQVFDEYTKGREQEYLANAPSARSAKRFQVEFMQSNLPLYQSALKAGAENRVTNLQLSAQTQVEHTIDSWRTAQSVPGLDAGEIMHDSIDRTNKFIDQTFGGIAPEYAKKLKDEMTVQAAYATADVAPGLAREVLAKSKTLDERTRATILNHIDQSEQSRDSANTLLFNQRRDDMLADASVGKFGGKIDISTYSLFYPDAKGSALKSRDDAIYDAYESAHKDIETLAPLNSGAQNREFQKISGKASGEAGKLRLSVVAQKMNDIARLQEKDPAAWLKEYNPQVRAAIQRATKLPDGSYDYSESHELIAKYQQAPGPDDKDKDMFLYKPAKDINLLTVAEAEDVANRINNGAPSQVLIELDKFNSQFSAKFHAAAFNDLVTLPSKGIKQEYQLAFLNKDQMWVKEYLGAVGKTDFSKFNEDTKRDFNMVLMSDPTFMRFTRMFKREGLQGGPDIEGFRSGILNYAYAKSFSRGISASKAVAESSRELLLSEMGAATVNGNDLWVMRKRDNAPRRQDDEIAVLGNRMSALLQTVPVDKISLKSPDGVDLFPAMRNVPNDKSKRAKLQSAIQSNGVWVSDPDGCGATLYYNDGYHPFQLTTTNHKPLGVRYADVENDPWFTTAITAKAPGSFGSSSTGFSGMGNLFNPWSQFNIVNMVYGTGGRGTKVGQGAALGLVQNFYLGQSTLYSTNWPTLVKEREY